MALSNSAPHSLPSLFYLIAMTLASYDSMCAYGIQHNQSYNSNRANHVEAL